MPEFMDSDDIIGNNILDGFWVTHKLQYVLGSMRVIIKNNTVKLPSNWHNLYSFILFIGATFSEWCYQKTYVDLFYHRNLIMYWTCLFGTGSVYVSYVICLNVVRFAKREENRKIYSVLQKINRLLDLHTDYYFIRNQIKLQRRLAVIICTIFTIGFAMHCIPLLERPLESVFLVPALLTNYIDILHCGSFMYFLEVRLCIFNKMLKNHSGTDDINDTPKSGGALADMFYGLFFPSYDRVDGILELNRAIECIQEMLKVYKMISTNFSFHIFNWTVTAVLWTFISISLMVVGLRSGLHPLLSTVMVGIWTSSYFVLLIAITMINHWILNQIKETKRLCVRVMSYDNDDSYHKAASEILRIIHYTNPKFQVYGVFSVEASLPLTIMGIITSNVLVCVQFIVDQEKNN